MEGEADGTKLLLGLLLPERVGTATGTVVTTGSVVIFSGASVGPWVGIVLGPGDSCGACGDVVPVGGSTGDKAGEPIGVVSHCGGRLALNRHNWLKMNLP